MNSRAPLLSKLDLYRREKDKTIGALLAAYGFSRSPQFRAIIRKGGGDARDLTRPPLYLDAVTLDCHYAELGDEQTFSSAFSQGMAMRIARSLARKYHTELGLSQQALADAWSFSLWTELCTLLPTRKLAARLCRIADGRPVLIPIDPGVRKYLSYWKPNACEPFYLYKALERQGVRVAFVVADSDQARAALRARKFAIRFEADDAWRPSLNHRARNIKSRKIIVPSGIRSIDKISAFLEDPLTVGGIHAPWSNGFDAMLIAERSVPPVYNLTFRRAAVDAQFSKEYRIFDAAVSTVDVLLLMRWLVGKTTKSAAAEARRLVDKHQIEESHVCDHLFFEAALIAHAVREKGGKNVLWPHSTNAVHVKARQRNNIPDRIYCTTRAAAENWRSHLGNANISIVTDLMLAAPSAPRAVSPEEPLNVVVIAGAHSLARMSLVRRSIHEQCYRRLFSRLSELAPGVRILCKAKAPFESMSWLRSLAPPDVKLEETHQLPSEIDLPNLVYITVSWASSALLEGIVRGIPAMVVRRGNVVDYVEIDPSVIPVGDVDMIISQIESLKEPRRFKEMVAGQIAWLKTQTSFADLAHTG